MLKFAYIRDYRPLIWFICLGVLLILSPLKAQQNFDEFLANDQRAYDEFEREQQEAYARYVQNIINKWNEYQESTQRDWYEYSGDLNTLSKVDFEAGEITVETLVEKDTPDIMRQAEANISEQVNSLMRIDSLVGQKILENQIEFKSGDKVKQNNAKEFVHQEVIPQAKIVQQPVKSKDGVERVKVTATFKMVPNHLRIRAEKYLPLVKKYCKKYQLEVPLVMAVMQTESYFNPRAKSPAPAYGLMQLVPKSGAREAYRHAYKQDKIVKPNYLYVPENNIHLGCAYLGKLRDVEFKRIEDGINQRYCMIASYNTGPGNLSRAITGNRDVYSAVDRINRMPNDHLYQKLTRDLPYPETRDYLVKVENRRENYEEWR